ncbi:hypothetical protein MPTK1_2g05650 [Marchantia polymorpha subsp. ruderalis]|uniref:Uncharacterized protein n=1 Tax=Marchantia polymorpha TaxID=3197 RepID=A0A2R6XDK1_MARPO|nr:hypothetical protein MARPO_0021s0021 [Marchantia polymorpha]BBN01215.1 hypothetical protein Mp_2g05650 [Marchantia polymorpha subsp. ruderalis]|eukprot:PTQ44139.1 hypothetical protein MARPO_0021s0021 [Marchantia polymorpha]
MEGEHKCRVLMHSSCAYQHQQLSAVTVAFPVDRIIKLFHKLLIKMIHSASRFPSMRNVTLCHRDWGYISRTRANCINNSVPKSLTVKISVQLYLANAQASARP